MRSIRLDRGSCVRKTISQLAGGRTRSATARPARGAAAEPLETRVLLSVSPRLSYGPDTGFDANFASASAAAASQATAVQPAHLVIDPIFDSTITNDPNHAAIEAALNTAIANFESDIATPITVTIDYKEITTGLAQSLTARFTTTYSAFRSALASHATSTSDTTALANIPTGSTNPINDSTVVKITTANARALGFSAPAPSGIDSTIGLNMSLFNTDRYNVDPNKYDLVGSVSHEMDEVLGINSALTGLDNGAPVPTGFIFSEDLFRYNASGGRSFNTNADAAAYFSIDGGNTLLDEYNQIQGGDFNDWSHPSGVNPQVQDAQGTPGARPNLGVELIVLDVLGYKLASGVQGGYLPDLHPFRPAAWSAPLVLATQTGAVTDASSITTSNTVFLDAALINEGEIYAPSAFTVTIVLDGSVKFTFTDPAFVTVNTVEFSTSLSLGKLSAGSHTVTMNIDTQNQVNEIIESNNSISRTFTVTGPGSAPTIGSLSVSPTSALSGASATVTANNVAVTGSTIASVAFYIESNNQSGLQTGAGGDELLATDTTSPYSDTESTAGLAAGTYALYAVATDKLGHTSATASTTLTVTSKITVAAPSAQTASSGASKSFTLGSFTQVGATGPFSVDVNWGDGTTDTKLSVSSAGTIPATAHTFASSGSKTVSITVTDSASHTSNKATFAVTVASSAGSIAGNVFSDTNADGISNNGEKGISGVKVYIDANKNGSLDSGEVTVTTDSSGNYKFTGLAPGSYRIREVVPTNDVITSPTAGFYDITLTAGQAVTAKVFADAPATASISGKVFDDVNGNGVRDKGELGLGLWEVFIDTNNDGKIDGTEQTVLTDINGNWTFKGLTAGKYVVRVVPVAGAVATKPTGALTVTLVAGQASTTSLFGEKSTT